jgi:carbon monoxide dehydrogenase subunit G
MLEVAATINAPAAVAWRFLTDTHAWPQWGPSVRSVEAPARFITAGMRGRVQTTFGVWLPFEITHWGEGSHWSWTVAGIPATGHLIQATGPHGCRVTFTIPVWAPFYRPVCRTALRALGRLATRVEQ